MSESHQAGVAPASRRKTPLATAKESAPIAAAKKAADRVQKRMAELGTPIKRTLALEIMAAVNDAPDWNQFVARSSAFEPSPPPPTSFEGHAIAYIRALAVLFKYLEDYELFVVDEKTFGMFLNLPEVTILLEEQWLTVNSIKFFQLKAHHNHPLWLRATQPLREFLQIIPKGDISKNEFALESRQQEWFGFIAMQLQFDSTGKGDIHPNIILRRESLSAPTNAAAHTLLFGRPGSGKTTTLSLLFEDLWRSEGIPVFVDWTRESLTKGLQKLPPDVRQNLKVVSIQYGPDGIDCSDVVKWREHRTSWKNYGIYIHISPIAYRVGTYASHNELILALQSIVASWDAEILSNVSHIMFDNELANLVKPIDIAAITEFLLATCNTSIQIILATAFLHDVARISNGIAWKVIAEYGITIDRIFRSEIHAISGITEIMSVPIWLEKQIFDIDDEYQRIAAIFQVVMSRTCRRLHWAHDAGDRYHFSDKSDRGRLFNQRLEVLE